MQPLLRTRTTIPPTRPRQIARTALHHRLEEGARRALTLIVAPAGFGKTSLAAAWAQHQTMPVAWLSFQAGAQSPVQYLSYIIQALQTVDARIGHSSQVLSQSGDLDVALFALVNDLAGFETELVLVLDDYHTVNSSGVNPVIQYLLDNRPGGFHLVIISRTPTELQLARLRALDQVVEIGTTDLRFSTQEMESFLEDSMQMYLPAETRQRLAQITEGWPVGLQLAAIALGQDPADPLDMHNQKHIFEYLADEVLKRESPRVQEFLKRTALFDRFCLPLCEYLYQDSDCQTEGCVSTPDEIRNTFNYIERANLFVVQLDSTWYRYHALFTEFLRPLVPQSHQQHLYRSASRWMEQNGLLTDAIHYTIHAGEYERAAEMVEDRYLQMLQSDEQTVLRELLDEFPKTVLENHPRLWLARGWIDVISMNSKTVEDCAHQAGRVAANLGQTQSVQAELMCMRMINHIFAGQYTDLSEITSVLELLEGRDDFLAGLAYFGLGLHHVIQGNTAGVIDALQQALERMELKKSPLVAIFVQTQLGETRMIRGALGLAERTFLDAINYTQETLGEHTLLLGLPYMSYAELLREENRLEEAQRYVQQGIAYLHMWQPITSLDGMITLSKIYMKQKRWEEAEEVLSRALENSRSSTSVLDDRVVAVQLVKMWIKRGDILRARQIIRTYNLEQERGEQYYVLWEVTRLVILRTSILEEASHPDALLRIRAELVELLELTGVKERTSSEVETLLLLGYVNHALNEHQLAAQCLSRAVAICAQCGYIRLLLDEGESFLHLLRQYRAQLHTPTAYIAAIENLIKEETGGRLSSRKMDDSLSPLTRRELDVLFHLAAGRSNQEIAAECTLTLNTVKKHVANILSKLGVANRTQAVLLARRSGWIPEK